MMWASSIWFLIILTVCKLQTDAEDSKSQNYQCKPVFLLHAGLTDNSSMTIMEKRIKEIDPKAVVLNSNANPGPEGGNPLWDQVHAVGKEFINFCKKHSDGITLICHSESASVCRALLGVFVDHCVHTFISIVGFQAGFYGVSAFTAPLVPLFQQPLTLELISDYLYNPNTSLPFAYADVWNDPTRHSDYLKYNRFLPYINNEVTSNQSQNFKKGFLKLKKLVTVTGPDGAVIIPYESSEFSYFNDKKTVISYKYTDIYKKDLFGLKTLDKEGRWVRYNRSVIEHYEFVTDKSVFEDFIRPHLDCTKKRLLNVTRAFRT